MKATALTILFCATVEPAAVKQKVTMKITGPQKQPLHQDEVAVQWDTGQTDMLIMSRNKVLFMVNQ